MNTSLTTDLRRAAPDGDVLLPSDPAFPEARAAAIWNGDIRRQPSAIVRPTSAEEVARVLTAVRAAGSDLTVRGGGHSGAGNAVADDAVMIDLSRMGDVHVDPAARRAVVGGGATWGAVDAATAPHGLAVVGGTVSHTGVAGLTLSGGMGWLLSRQGLSCDNLAAATLVTADGRVVRASAEEEADLHWALRGAGTNFGVVTQLELQLHETAPLAHLAFLFWRTEDAAEALTLAREHLFAMPDSVGAIVVGMTAPPAPFVPPEVRGTPGIAVLLAGWGGPEELTGAAAPFLGRRAGVEQFMPIPYVALQQMINDDNPWGIRGHDRGLNLDDLSDEAIAVLVDRFPRKRSSFSFVPMFPLRGRYREVPDDATAYGSPRSARWAVSVLAMSFDDEVFEADLEWGRELSGALRSLAPDASTYVNFEAETTEDRVIASYGEAKYRRLAALKAVWDPDNVFRHNANIRPQHPAGRIPAPRAATASEPARASTT